MVQRVAFGALAIAVLVLLFIQDAAIARQSTALAGPLGDLLRRGSLIPLLFFVVLLRGAVELTESPGKDVKPHSARVPDDLVFFCRFSAAGWFGADVRDQEGLYWQLVALMATVRIRCCVLADILEARYPTWRPRC
jgi:hypothetical protein